MEKSIIENALLSALLLLQNEIDAIEYDELKNEYLAIIVQLQNALTEIEKIE